MKLRPMTWGRWVEFIFGAILPTVFVVPVAVFLMVFFGYAFFHGAFEYPGLLEILRQKREIWELGVFLLWLLLGLGIVSAVASMGLLILFGYEEVNRYPRLRGLAVAMGILGIIASGIILLFYGFPLFMHWRDIFPKPLLYDLVGIMREENDMDARLLLLGSIGLLVVWLRYLPALLKGKKS